MYFLKLIFFSFIAKKTKKKGKTLTLTDFLAEDSGSSAPPAYPAAKATSWADETDDLDGEGEQELSQRDQFLIILTNLNFN